MATGTIDPHDASGGSRRLTLSQIVEHLLHRGASANSSVTLTRNAKGETQIEVVCRTGESEHVQTLADAEALAIASYDRLRELYPLIGSGSNGARS